MRSDGQSIPLPYLEGCAEEVQVQVRELIARDQLDSHLHDRYGEVHEVRTDKALHRYAIELKDRFLRTAPPLGKAVYDAKLQVLSHALGTHTVVSRVQGPRLKASREIRIAAVFRDAPAAFLRMVVVHELAHFRESDHNKAFYQLCAHMAPDYWQLEFDLRLYLTLLDCRKGAFA